MRYLMTLTYDGSKYQGYQKQNQVVTIQEILETILTKINSNNPVKVVASGRTDAGVHALNQKAHFDLDKKKNPKEILKAINSLLPPDIYVKNIKIVNDDFHARYNVKKKEYMYKINIGEYNPLDKDYIYQYNQPLDIQKMRLALKELEGEHNFRAFTKVEEEKDFNRIIYKTTIKKETDIIIINIIGNGFLRYMVRNIVGLLIEVGSNQKDLNMIKSIIESHDRKLLGVMAPPQGLYLKAVKYM